MEKLSPIDVLVFVEFKRHSGSFLNLGTGKTITGAHIAYWFAYLNSRHNDNALSDTLIDEIPKKAPRQVFYCGPSNKSVDVVAGTYCVVQKFRDRKL